MYSSPATPAGTGHSQESSTYTRVLATGAPIGGPSSVPPRHAHAVESTAVSVGPYRLCRPAVNRAVDRPASGPGSASPLQTTSRRLAQPPGVAWATNASSIEGTK